MVLVRWPALLLSFLIPFGLGTIGPATRVGVASPASYEAKCNAAAADDAAITAADVAAVSTRKTLLFTQPCKVTANLAIASPVAFSKGGALLPDVGATITLNGSKVDAPVTAHIFKGAGTVATPNTSFVSIGWWGVDFH